MFLRWRYIGLKWRSFRRRWRALPRWVRWVVVSVIALSPLCAINICVSAVGHARVFPLSPFFIRNKVQALDAYSRHKPRCLLFGDDTVSTEMIARTEVRNHLPCGLLGAVVQVESGGRAHSISSAGAMGPLQLIPSTALALGVTDPFDPEESLDGAGRYLHAQMVTFHDPRLAAAAYNAGPGAIVHRAVPHNGQTEIYVARVMRAFVAERRSRCVPATRRK